MTFIESTFPKNKNENPFREVPSTFSYTVIFSLSLLPHLYAKG